MRHRRLPLQLLRPRCPHGCLFQQRRAYRRLQLLLHAMLKRFRCCVLLLFFHRLPFRLRLLRPAPTEVRHFQRCLFLLLPRLLLLQTCQVLFRLALLHLYQSPLPLFLHQPLQPYCHLLLSHQLLLL